MSATATVPAAENGQGRVAVVLAVLTVQVIALGAAVAAARPTAYALFMLASAAVLAYAGDGGLTGVAAATLGSVLLVARAFPLALFATRQDPTLVAAKLTDPAVHRMIYLSIYAPLLATLFALVTGVPLAYLLAEGFPGSTVVQSVVDLPLVVPHSVAGIVVLFGFGAGGAFPQLSVLGTVAGAVLALTFVSAPFTVDGAREAFESLDPAVVHAARAHGASPISAFLRVSLPLSARGILTGAILTWARAVSEFGAVAIVAYTIRFFYPPAGEVVRSAHAPVFIYQSYLSGSLAESGAISFILLGVSVAIFLAIRTAAQERGRML
jgi:molybdate/tungstate transport system permease protein